MLFEFTNPLLRMNRGRFDGIFGGYGRLFKITAYGLATVAAFSAEAAKAADLTPSALFGLTNLHRVSFKFTPEEWQAMEPTGNPGRFFNRLPAGPPERGGGPGPGGFGPAVFLVPTFLKEGDQNQDGKLSSSEFHELAAKWFADWDKGSAGRLDLAQLRLGLNSTFMPKGFGARAGGPGGPGFSMNLQGEEGKRNGLASATGIEFKYVHANLEFDGVEVNNVAVRYKGNGTFMQSRDSLKRSLKVDLAKYEKGPRLAGIRTLNFHNSVTDASWMNEVLSHQLFRDAGVPAPRTAYARVFVTVPGKFDRQYFGLYSVVEDVDQNFALDRFGSKGGAIFKPVTPNLFADLGDDWKSYNQTYDPKMKLSPEQKKRVIDFSKLISHASDTEVAEKLAEFLDLEEFARFMAVEVWLSTLDSILTIGQNYYVYLSPEKQQFEFIPWDLDHSFGQFFLMGSQKEREQLSIQHPWRGQNRFLERVFANSTFKNLYLIKLSQFSRDIFAPERFYRQVDEIAGAIRPAVEEESVDKLSRFDRVIAGESVAPAGFGGPREIQQSQRASNSPGQRRESDNGQPFGGPGGFFQSVQPIKVFVKARALSVRDQLEGRSEGQLLSEFGFGASNGRGGRGGPPGGFGPAMFLSGGFMEALDHNQDGAIDRDEFLTGFDRWFRSWNVDASGLLTQDQLRSGINQEFSPFKGAPPPVQ